MTTTKRETIYLFKLTDSINKTLASYVNTQIDECNSIADIIDEAVRNDGSIDTEDFYYEDEDGCECFDDEAFDEAVSKYKEELTEADIKSYLDSAFNTGAYDYFYDHISDELSERNIYDEEDCQDDEDLELYKLNDERPDLYVWFTQKEIDDKKLKESNNGFLEYNGYKYLYVSEY